MTPNTDPHKAPNSLKDEFFRPGARELGGAANEGYLEALGLSTRAITILKKHKIYTVDELCAHKASDLIWYKGLGKTTYSEITDALTKINRKLS